MASNYSPTELFGRVTKLNEDFNAGTEYTISLLKVEGSASAATGSTY